MVPAMATNAGGRAASAASINQFFQVSLLAMLTFGYLAVLATGVLDIPSVIITASALIVRGLLTAGLIEFTIPARWTNTAAVLYLGFFPLDEYYLSKSFLMAVVHMVFFLAVLKLLTSKTERDYGYLKIIAGMEIIASAVLSSGLSFLIFLTLFLLAAVATFASSEVRRGATGQDAVSRSGLKLFPRRLGTFVGLLFAGILFISAGMFLVLPRTARGGDGAVHSSALSHDWVFKLGEFGRNW